MSPHFCKVRRIKPNLDKVFNLKAFEVIASNLVDDVSKLEFPEYFKSSNA